jgi:hypothetical protein
METFDIPIAASRDPAVLIEIIERATSEAGLLAQRQTLRSYPGSTHWHFKQPGASGTLELTYWPQTGRLWFTVHANRRAEWIAAAMAALRERIVDLSLFLPDFYPQSKNLGE